MRVAPSWFKKNPKSADLKSLWSIPNNKFQTKVNKKKVNAKKVIKIKYKKLTLNQEWKANVHHATCKHSKNRYAQITIIIWLASVYVWSFLYGFFFFLRKPLKSTDNQCKTALRFSKKKSLWTRWQTNEKSALRTRNLFNVVWKNIILKLEPFCFWYYIYLMYLRICCITIN